MSKKIDFRQEKSEMKIEDFILYLLKRNKAVLSWQSKKKKNWKPEKTPALFTGFNLTLCNFPL